MSLANRLAPQDRRDLLADLLAMVARGQGRDRPRRLPLPGCALPRAALALRFFYYPYPLVAPLGGEDLAVASPLDLGLMKLGAIISRGSRRDFVDLHLLCRELPLAGAPPSAPRRSSGTSAISPCRR